MYSTVGYVYCSLLYCVYETVPYCMCKVLNCTVVTYSFVLFVYVDSSLYCTHLDKHGA